MLVHHVKEIGKSSYTTCGLRCLNNGTSITQDGEITCKECLKYVNDEVREQ